MLWCGDRPPPDGVLDRLTAARVSVVRLADEVGADAFVPAREGLVAAERSERVRLALERRHARGRFAEVRFPSLGGLGFRSVQAQRCGVAFDGVRLSVSFDGASASFRDRRGRLPAGADDLALDHGERYAFENAACQYADTDFAREQVRRLGWKTPPTAEAATTAAVADSLPLVSVCVPFFNLGRHLPATLASLAAQSYPAIEVVVIDDGSTDPDSIAVFEAMRTRYPRFRFVRQTNAGIGATRNRGLAEARGVFFLPVDADNVCVPTMVERFVRAMQRRPEVTALTCYFLAFHDDEQLRRGRFDYAYRPTGGPALLGCLRNVYGDANALFRTDRFRAAGGFEVDRGTSFEDWEAFVKLVRLGQPVDVLPEVLFYYRHLPTGFSRTTSAHANHRRVLRQYTRSPATEAAVWELVAGMGRRIEELEARQAALRYRLIDRVYGACRLAPPALRGVKRLLLGCRAAWQHLRGLVGRNERRHGVAAPAARGNARLPRMAHPTGTTERVTPT